MGGIEKRNIRVNGISVRDIGVWNALFNFEVYARSMPAREMMLQGNCTNQMAPFDWYNIAHTHARTHTRVCKHARTIRKVGQSGKKVVRRLKLDFVLAETHDLAISPRAQRVCFPQTQLLSPVHLVQWCRYSRRSRSVLSAQNAVPSPKKQQNRKDVIVILFTIYILFASLCTLFNLCHTSTTMCLICVGARVVLGVECR